MITLLLIEEYEAPEQTAQDKEQLGIYTQEAYDLQACS
jgi:hypothetical protein